MQAEATEDIRTAFNTPDRTTAEARLTKAVEKYQKTDSRLRLPSDVLNEISDDWPTGRTYLTFQGRK